MLSTGRGDPDHVGLPHRLGDERRDPGHVGSSFLAYKISGAAGVACVSSSCPAGVTVGNTKPCGDPMPNANGQGGTAAVLTDAERSKILDWIALGAHD